MCIRDSRKLRDTRRQIRELRRGLSARSVQSVQRGVAPKVPSADVVATTRQAQLEALARAHISRSLGLAQFPTHWADSFSATGTDPCEVARTLLAALGRVQ